MHLSAYIGLGSNLNGPISQIQHAITAFKWHESLKVVQVSSLYRSKPLGGLPHPDYVNAVAEITTALSPTDLHEVMQTIERAQGRERSFRHAPRTLDLDLLFYGNLSFDTPDLVVPHPGVYSRNFWLYPLFEIVPQFVFPNGLLLSEFVASCSMEGLSRIESLDLVESEDVLRN